MMTVLWLAPGPASAAETPLPCETGGCGTSAIGIAEVSEPGAMLLFGTSLIVLAGMVRARQRRATAANAAALTGPSRPQ